jgi:hypothetical protein
MLYETALFYYNVVVYISWVLCYVAVEFVCNKKGISVNVSGMKTTYEDICSIKYQEKI